MMKRLLKLIKLIGLTILLLLCMNMRGHNILSELFHFSSYVEIFTHMDINSSSLHDLLFQILWLCLVIGVPILTLLGCIYLIYYSNLLIRSISVCYVLFFIAFLIIPSLRYTTIGHAYRLNTIADIGPRLGSTEIMPTIPSGTQFILQDCDLHPDDDRRCIPILCNLQYGCFILYGHADNEYYRLPQDPRRWYARIFF